MASGTPGSAHDLISTGAKPLGLEIPIPSRLGALVTLEDDA